MLKNAHVVPAEVPARDWDPAGGPIHHSFGGGPTISWWGILGWWGLFRDGRDPRLVAFGRSDAQGFGGIRDWVV
jgi:hypothetical protein